MSFRRRLENGGVGESTFRKSGTCYNGPHSSHRVLQHSNLVKSFHITPQLPQGKNGRIRRKLHLNSEMTKSMAHGEEHRSLLWFTVQRLALDRSQFAFKNDSAVIKDLQNICIWRHYIFQLISPALTSLLGVCVETAVCTVPPSLMSSGWGGLSSQPP